MSQPAILLVDNGSLEPAATLRLRELAQALGERLGEPVAPVSLLHSSAILAAQLGGRAAEILEPALSRRIEAGVQDFIVVPLFFGPSRALTDYLPERVGHLRKRHPALRVRLAAPLFEAHDNRLARVLADHVQELEPADRVALVDHGSPVPAVTAVRDELARQLGRILGPAVTVAPASMERRAGPEFDFGEPLLAGLLARPPWRTGDVVVAMQFLLPGRHAGPAGDVAQICRSAEESSPGLRTRMTRLVAEHPLLIEILADRRRAVAD